MNKRGKENRTTLNDKRTDDPFKDEIQPYLKQLYLHDCMFARAGFILDFKCQQILG